jgi:hypothetical protein
MAISGARRASTELLSEWNVNFAIESEPVSAYPRAETPTITPPANRSQLRLADDAGYHSRRVSAGDVDRDEGALLPPPGVANSLKAGRGILPGGYASAVRMSRQVCSY